VINIFSNSKFFIFCKFKLFFQTGSSRSFFLRVRVRVRVRLFFHLALIKHVPINFLIEVIYWRQAIKCLFNAKFFKISKFHFNYFPSLIRGLNRKYCCGLSDRLI